MKIVFVARKPVLRADGLNAIGDDAKGAYEPVPWRTPTATPMPPTTMPQPRRPDYDVKQYIVDRVALVLGIDLFVAIAPTSASLCLVV